MRLPRAPRAQAAALASSASPDLILVSQSLDDATGVQVLQHIRQTLGWRSWPTTVLIARREGAPQNWQNVAEHCVVLPESIGELHHIIDALAPASQSSQSLPIPLPIVGEVSGSIASLHSMGGNTLRSTVQQFGGAMPEWTQDLYEAIERADHRAVAMLCRLIGDSAEIVGADHLTRAGRDHTPSWPKPGCSTRAPVSSPKSNPSSIGCSAISCRSTESSSQPCPRSIDHE